MSVVHRVAITNIGGRPRFALTLAALLFFTGTGVVSAAADTAPGALWGDRHRPFFAHPLRGWSGDLDTLLATPAAALGGDLDCVFAAGSPIGIFDMVIVGSTARYVFDLADRDAGGWIVPLGASGHPASPHFADQHQRWADGELLPIVSDWSRLEHEATAQLRLSAA